MSFPPYRPGFSPTNQYPNFRGPPQTPENYRFSPANNFHGGPNSGFNMPNQRMPVRSPFQSYIPTGSPYVPGPPPFGHPINSPAEYSYQSPVSTPRNTHGRGGHFQGSRTPNQPVGYSTPRNTRGGQFQGRGRTPNQRGSNPGGSANIRSYYHPSMVEDPWRGIIPVPVTKDHNTTT